MSLVRFRAAFALISLLSLVVASQTVAQPPDPFGDPADGVQVFDDPADPFGGAELIGGADPFGDPDVLAPLPRVKENAKPPEAVVIRPAAAAADAAGEARVLKALNSKTTLEFIETPLLDVTDFIADLHGIDVQIDKRALEDVGIGGDTPITRRLRGISLRSALRLMLREMDLTYIVHGGTILITTPEESESGCGLQTEVYPVGHLLRSSDPLTDDDFYAGDELIDLVTSITRPTTWEYVGGSGSVMVLRNCLIVTNTREVQEEIADLLTTLNKAQKIVDASRTKPPKIVSLPPPPAAEGRIFKALAADIDCDFRETPLQDVVDFFVEKTKIEIQIDHRALEDVGIGSDTPITLKLKGVSMGSALRLMLREMDLVYVVRDEVLLITTPEEAESELRTRIFPVADLVLPHDDETLLFDTDWQAEADYDALIDLITTTMRPYTWDDVGGPGSIEPWHGCLVLSQTDDVLDEVEQLLTGLRKLQAKIGDDPRRVIAEAVRLGEDESPKLAKLREALDGDVGMLAFKNTPLTQVMRKISDKHGVPILIDLRALDDMGIDADTQLTATLGGESVAAALRRLLRPFDLTYVLRDEVILITTPDESESELVARIYPVGDLVLPVWSEFEDEADLHLLADFGQLADTIIGTVRPTTWEEVGGVGTIQSYYPVLGSVISQTEDVHEEIADLLAQVRKVEAASREEDDDTDVAKPPVAKLEVVKNKQGERLHLKVYPLVNKKPERSQELAEVIRDLVEPKSWKADDNYYLRPLSGSIIVRHTATTHRKIDNLLRELEALQWPQFDGFDGGGFNGVDSLHGFGQGFNQGGVFAVPDHIQGNFGGAASNCSHRGPLAWYASAKTIHSLSMPAREDRAAMPLRVYPNLRDDADEVVAAIRDLVNPETWDGPDYYLRAVANKLIVRHDAPTHRQTYRLLIDLYAIPQITTRNPYGGGLRSVIPVVGERE